MKCYQIRDFYYLNCLIFILGSKTKAITENRSRRFACNARYWWIYLLVILEVLKILTPMKARLDITYSAGWSQWIPFCLDFPYCYPSWTFDLDWPWIFCLGKNLQPVRAYSSLKIDFTAYGIPYGTNRQSGS